MDYGKKFEELRDRARRKAEEADAKFGIRDRLGDTAKIAEEALRKSAQAAREAADAVREQAERVVPEGETRERFRDAATAARDAASNAKDAATGAFRTGASAAEDAFRTGARTAEPYVSDFFGEAKQYYRTAAGAAAASTAAVFTATTVAETVASARTWIRENPGKATIVTLSLVAGVRAGSAWPALDVTILGAGASGHWFFHSAIAAYGMRKLSERYMSFLKEQERLLAEGKLTEAERARVEFQHNAAKYVGAPLLGAFSVAAGATLMYEAFTGGAVVGFPVNLILGGNPILNSVWLFGNGLVCFHNGYKFFMMALAKEDEVDRVVRQLKGLLPAAAVS
jgi:hypothetical protein